MTNWYIRYTKTAQIWKTKFDRKEDLESKLRKLYELEYKYHQLLMRGFSGVPRRRENILKNLESSLEGVILEIKNVLVNLFSEWLDSHALLNPEIWAKKRVEHLRLGLGYDEEEILDAILAEIKIYTNKKEGKYVSAFSELYKSGGAFKSYIDSLISKWVRLDEEELEYAIENGDEEEAQYYRERIESLSDPSIEDIEDLLESGGIDLYSIPLKDRDFEILFEKLAFPKWLKHWKKHGILQTRENVKKTFEMVQSIGSGGVSSDSAKINIALNTAHQSGDLVEYLGKSGEFSSSGEGEVKQLLDDLSAMSVDEWNEELRGIGCDV
jgi:hypothetical protein